MKGNNNFALIKGYEIKNIICSVNGKTANYETANQIARETYGQDAIAIDCTYYQVGIGDIYKDNQFINKETNEPCEYLGTDEENIEILKKENELYLDTILDLDYRLQLLEEA